MKIYRVLFALVLAALVVYSGTVYAKGKAKPKKKAPAAAEPASKSVKPWSLRDQYTFNVGTNTLTFGVETAEWKLDAAKIGNVVDDTGFRITFADGTIWDSSNMGKATTDREPFKNDLGAGRNFWLEFPPKNNLIVRCNILLYTDEPYFFVKFAIGNTGTKPVEVAKIAPAVMGPNGIHGLGADTTVGVRHIVARDSFPVFNPAAPALLTIFNDRANGFAMSLGVLPEGIAAPQVDIKPSGGKWLGGVEYAYNPPVRIDPGQKFEADPLWICAGLSEPAKIDTYYSWAWHVLRPQAVNGEVPRAWASAEGATGENDLYQAVKEWGGAQVKYALVPAVWEGRPGSLEGSTPHFPKNMAKVADQIHGLGAKAGIAVDPLLAGGGPNTAASADGRKWFNVSSPEGMKAATERLQKVVGWGYDFFAVAPSGIPDDVLKQFHMTHAQADSLAFAAMTHAAGSKPVLPTAAATLKAGLDEWLEAAASSARMAEFQVVPGPVRLDASAVNALEETVLAAMTLFNGPIELTGKPNSAVVRQLADIVVQPPIPARPIDAANTSPRIWNIVTRGVEGPRGGSVVVFPGGRAWNLSELETEKDQQLRLWNPTNGQFIDAAQGAAKQLTVYGVMIAAPHPSLMGASTGLALLLNDLTALSWNEEKAALSGTFRGSNRETATAYVNVPEGWKLKSGKAGKSAVKKEGADRVAFNVEAGIPTNFQLEFNKK